MRRKKDHISVCICTYKRPMMLRKALEGIIAQETADSTFIFDVVVVDNDFEESARKIIEEMRLISNINMIYDCETERNVALARNRAVKNAKGNLIAFLDDDEIPNKNWLVKLYNTLIIYGVDGVLGPVIPFYPSGAPAWLLKCDLFGRRRFRTGSILDSRDTRTGNVLVKRDIFANAQFNPKFGLTGGEDVDFFEKQIRLGRRFIWCDDAVVFEVQPPERWKRMFFIHRAIRIGVNSGRRMAESRGRCGVFFLKAALNCPLYLAATALGVLFGPQFYMNFLVKIIYNISWICGYLRIIQPRLWQLTGH